MAHRGPDFFQSRETGVDVGVDAGNMRRSTSQVFAGFEPAAVGIVGQQLFNAGTTALGERGWASLDSLRYYFSVSNSYVKNKLRLLLFPFAHKNWTRLIVSQGDGEAYRPPRDDINAPDLYIPVMSFLTWMIVSAVLLGTDHKFTPEAFGACASKGFAVVVLEVLLLKAGFYLLSDAPSPNTLVLACWSGYKFVGVIINLVAYLLFGSLGYFTALIYNGLCMAYFFRGVMRVAWLSSSSATAGQYFRIVVMGLQFLFPLLLG